MLGQPVYFLTPDVVGVHLTGKLREGVTATDLVLTVTEMLRKAKVVGKFVEFFGEGAASLPVPDRATIANMAPEYGATMGFFPIDDETVEYLRAHRPHARSMRRVRDYYKAQGMFGIPQDGEIDYSQVRGARSLRTVQPSVAGPKRPQDRIELANLKAKFTELFSQAGRPRTASASRRDMARRRVPPDAAGRQADDRPRRRADRRDHVLHQHLQPRRDAGGRTAGEEGGRAGPARSQPLVKTSLAPGSRVVTDYLTRPACSRTWSNWASTSSPTAARRASATPGRWTPESRKRSSSNDLISAAVLSGNRNFEARVHQSIKANFLMSPAAGGGVCAGRTVLNRPDQRAARQGQGRQAGLPEGHLADARRGRRRDGLRQDRRAYRKLYRDFAAQNPKWNEIPAPPGSVYQWDPRRPTSRSRRSSRTSAAAGSDRRDQRRARAGHLRRHGDHRSHLARRLRSRRPRRPGSTCWRTACRTEDFNSYGSRRGNDRVMTRGTFANVRIKNLMVAGTAARGRRRDAVHQPSGEKMTSTTRRCGTSGEGTPLVVFGGPGVRHGQLARLGGQGHAAARREGGRAAELRAHPPLQPGRHGRAALQFKGADTAQIARLNGDETFDLVGVGRGISSRSRT